MQHMPRKIAFTSCLGLAVAIAGASCARAQTAEQAWLNCDLPTRIHPGMTIAVHALGDYILEQTSVNETQPQPWPDGRTGRMVERGSLRK
jgi:hypothetical protein